MASKHSQAPYLISQGIFDSIKTFKEFEIKVSALFETNTKAQGDAFEIFVEAYLLTQPITQCAETWLVGSIPVEVREELNLPNDSKGIDGVFKSTNDVLVPYQVKFRSNRPALGFNEVAPFLGITEKAVDRLLITNCDTIAIDVKNRTGIRSLRGVDFDQLTEEDFLIIENWLKAKPAKRETLVPYPYQIEALKDIKSHLQLNDRASVVMACGTGKTLVALWAVEQSKAKSILVLLPSLTLLQQTLSEWSAHNSWGKKFSYLCVCSDPQVDLKNDEIEIDTTDVPFKIDTDSEVVKSYLAHENGKVKIVFSTYQSSQVVSQATKDLFTFDIGVFDEAHKTTGVAEGRFALALKDENISISKRLFFTATPKHYDISKRNKDGEFKFVSMDDESIYGSRAHTLSFSRAAEKGIICPYKVVVTLIDKTQVDDFALKNGITLVEGDTVKAKWVASQVAVSSAIQHTNAKKVITFHSRVKTASDFASDEIYGIKKFLPNFDVFHIHGKQRSNERKDTISKFKTASKSLITNAKCLTEGVDVPAVDMVAFVDPRHSKIDIAQAVGRAMRKPRGGNKQLGYIVVPIYAESIHERDLDKAILEQNFESVAAVLNSLQEQDDELVELVGELTTAKGRDKFFNPYRLIEKIEVIGLTVSLDKITSNIHNTILDRLGSTWDHFFGCLINYKNKEGHCLVPVEYTDDTVNLGRWVHNQRSLKNKIAADKLKKLNDLGFVWDAIEFNWQKGFEELIYYKNREGHCLVPIQHQENKFNLGIWVSTQRKQKDELRSDRINRLNEIGFVWDVSSSLWDEGYRKLIAYKEREGHSNVPFKHTEDNFNLGKWASRQRSLKEKLLKERVDKLNELGFIWDYSDYEWEKGINELKYFYETEGHSNVPIRNSQNDFKLGQWITNIRKTKDSISSEKINQLKELNFVWDVLTNDWEISFSALTDFYKREGHSKVPLNHFENNINLGQWVSVQRRQKAQNKIYPDRLKRLEALDFVWDILEDQWEIGFNFLVAYKSEKGDCNVPQTLIVNNFKLGLWVSNQRKQKVQLSSNRLKRLEDLGFSWRILDEKWDEGYLYLKVFHQREGHCKVVQAHIEDGFKLGSWVSHQRKGKEKLAQEKIKKLDELNFIWDLFDEQWQYAFTKFLKFKSREGHSKVPSTHVEDDIHLGNWVNNQRKKKLKISVIKLDLLNNHGFIW